MTPIESKREVNHCGPLDSFASTRLEARAGWKGCQVSRKAVAKRYGDKKRRLLGPALR